MINRDTLLEIAGRANKIPCLNDGGCGFFALKIGNEFNLNSFLFINENISNDQKFDIVTNQKIHAPNHVMIQIENELFDSTGFYTLESLFDKKYYVKRMPVILNPGEKTSNQFDAIYKINKKYLKTLLLSKHKYAWNSDYLREYNKLITNSINNTLFI